jgi:CheY-like chemotaxis protein/two-component sensor histidine kinase
MPDTPKRLEERLSEATESLRQREEQLAFKDVLLTTLSRELRTPLNAILGWATLLSNRSNDPEVARAAATIRRNAQLQNRIVEDVLDVSRIAAGQLRIESKPLSFAAIVRDEVEVARPAANAKRLSLVVERLTTPAPVLGDATRLRQVVWNVLSNAIKFSDPGGSVHVELLTSGAASTLTVRDTGRGIDPELLAHVFDGFRRSDGAATRRLDGIGLGLAIVKHVVELHGGEIAITSAGHGHGCMVTLRLPSPAEESSEESAVKSVKPELESGSFAASRAEARLEGLRVLVVEDEPDTRELLQLVLEEEGAIVAGAGSAASAREAMNKARIDVIVSDIGMPLEDGYDLIRSVRALGAAGGGATPAVALTAYARPEDRARALAAGFDEHVAKPIDPEVLLRVVQRLGALAAARSKAD